MPKVKAAISSCTATISPTVAGTSSTKSLTFSIANTDDQSGNVTWVKITSPSGSFTITGGTASGWSTSASSSEITFENGNLGTGATASFTLNVTTGSSAAGGQSFGVSVSDSAGGGNPVTCTGSTSVAIVALTISGATVSNISTSGAKVSWTTSENGTSVVQYGTSSSYGTTVSDGTLKTSHSLDISNLSANTTYHFQIQSVDSSGNTVAIDDSTFTTAKTGSSTTTTVTVKTTETKVKVVEDTTPPGISLTSDFDKVYPTAAKISGTATDNVGVTKVEYSLDDGKNWLPVDYQSSIGAKSATFYFTPEIVDDGSFSVKARVTDPSGNKSVSRAYTLVIDRLPPQVGGQLISLGPQALTPQADGVVVLVKELDHRLTVSSIGGAVTLEITAGKNTIPLVKNRETGLWSGKLNFSAAGPYTLQAAAVDGAHNRSLRELTSVYVVENGRVTDGGKPLQDATVTLYVFEPVSQTFVLWNGTSYGQANPQNVAGDGHYVLFPPSGKYYLEVSAPGYYRETTAIFTLSQPTPITTDFTLQKAPGVSVGVWQFTWPSMRKLFGLTAEIRVRVPVVADREKYQYPLLEKELPVVDLYGETGTVSTLDLTGRPTVMTFLTSWLPQTGEQLSILSTIAQNSQLRAVPVMVQESVEKTVMIAKGGLYGLSLLSDHDGLLVTPLNIQSLPTHLFLNRQGIIKKIKYGVMTNEEILDNIVN